MAQRSPRTWSALVALAPALFLATSGCALIAGFQSIVDDSGAGAGGGAATTSGAETGASTSAGSSGAAPAFRCVFVQRFDGSGDQALGGIAADAQGTLWLTGSYKGTMAVDGKELPGGASASDNNAFAIALDGASGKPRWSGGFGDDKEQAGLSIAAKDSGVFVTGTSIGAINFGCKPDASEDTSFQNIWMAELDLSGCVREAGVFDNQLTHRSPLAAADGDRMLLAGVHASSPPDIFLQNNDLALKPGTSVPQTSFPQDQGSSLTPRAAFAASGGLYVAGDFTSSGELGGEALMGDAAPSAFVAAYSYAKIGEALKPRFAKPFGGAGAQSIAALTGDRSGALFVAGSFEKTIEFGAGSQRSSAGGKDVFVSSIDADTGAVRWQASFGDALDQAGTAVAYDTASQALFVAGEFRGTLDVDGVPFTNEGATLRAFLLRLDSTDGKARAAAQFTSDADLHVTAMAASNQGVYLAGTAKGALGFGCAGGPLPAGSTTRIFVVKLEPTVP